MIGIEYDVWDIPDCEITNDLLTRGRLVRYIRQFNPDIVFCHRTNDYHADHRTAAQLMQDASYLLIVPNYCPDTPAMRAMPVIMHFYDSFTSPSFRPDVIIDTDSVVEKKYEMIAQHVSQVFEWLPYTEFTLDTVPAGEEARMEWLKREPITADTTDEEVLAMRKCYPRRFAFAAARYRDLLIRRYGEERGRRIRFAEVYECSEYGTQLTRETEKKLFPF